LEHDPEERLDRIEATLERAAKLQEKMNLRHAGIRTLYRQGVNRLEEMMDWMDRQGALIEALIDSQLRTEQNLQRLEKTVDEAVKGIRSSVEDLASTLRSL
jgi:predicted  nucleic acid-binding Zn-ribbon protein